MNYFSSTLSGRDAKSMLNCWQTFCQVVTPTRHAAMALRSVFDRCGTSMLPLISDRPSSWLEAVDVELTGCRRGAVRLFIDGVDNSLLANCYCRISKLLVEATAPSTTVATEKWPGPRLPAARCVQVVYGVCLKCRRLLVCETS